MVKEIKMSFNYEPCYVTEGFQSWSRKTIPFHRPNSQESYKVYSFKRPKLPSMESRMKTQRPTGTRLYGTETQSHRG